MLGILLIDKPFGITSHDVVNEIRTRFRTKRVGHAGTLDPLATGVLVVAVGPATRFLQYLPLEPKEYVAEITFGASSDTYDREGKLTPGGAMPDDLSASIGDALPAFNGLIQQIPPLFSAIKVHGKPLYRYARQGQQVEREPRTVHIGAFEVQRLDGQTATCRIVCSGGTYVRSLAHDLGERIGCGAHLSGLVREGVGRFGRSMTTALAQVKPEQLVPLGEALSPMPLIRLDEPQTRQIREGRMLEVDCLGDGLPGGNFPRGDMLVGLLDAGGSAFSVARLVGNTVHPECVIPEEAILDPS